MKCKLIGIEHSTFTAKDTGEVITGCNLFVEDLKDTVGDARMQGRRCTKLWTSLAVNHLVPGDVIDLIYEQPLGAKYQRLVMIEKVFTELEQTNKAASPEPAYAGAKK